MPEGATPAQPHNTHADDKPGHELNFDVSLASIDVKVTGSDLVECNGAAPCEQQEEPACVISVCFIFGLLHIDVDCFGL